MYRKRQPEPLPYHRNFRLRLPADRGHLVVATTSRMVSVYHICTPHGQPDYSTYWLASDDPALAALHHDVWGWDLVALIGFIGRKIDVTKLNLRDGEAREFLDHLSTVSAPSRKQQQADKRPAGQSMKLIEDFVIEHPGSSRLEICRAIGRKKTPTSIAQIECLVEINVLARTHFIRPGGAVEYRYVFAGGDAI